MIAVGQGLYAMGSGVRQTGLLVISQAGQGALQSCPSPLRPYHKGWDKGSCPETGDGRRPEI